MKPTVLQLTVSTARWTMIVVAMVLCLFGGFAHAEKTADDITAAIIGGVEAQPGAWPFMAALVMKGYSTYNGQFCGGSLVHSKWVVTAAHCVAPYSKNDFKVVLNVHDLSSDPGVHIDASRVIVHPNYNSHTLDFDIALVELAQPATLPVVPLVTDSNSRVGEMATAIGWGLTVSGDSSSSASRLRQVSVPIVTNQTCNNLWAPGTVTANMICAGYPQGGKDICYGDSGGPLVVYNNSRWELQGIVSWTSNAGCAVSGYYGGYARVPQLMNFISSYVPGYGVAPPQPPATGGSYGLWNSFLNMTNILELVNDSNQTVSAAIHLYRIDGSLASQTDVTLAPQVQQDIIVNSLDGFTSDSYGIIRVTGSVKSRLFYYRSPNGQFDSFEFVFGLPLSSPTTGASYVGFNTFQPSMNPQDVHNLVANWFSVVNLSSSRQSFTLKKYDGYGTLLSSEHFSVSALGRVDLDGGHLSPGPANVGLLELIPDNTSAPYLAQLMRYGYAATGGFDFAFPLVAKRSSDKPLHVPVSGRLGAQNWVEVINTSSVTTNVTVDVYDASGNIIGYTNVELQPHGQVHIDVNSVLSEGTRGHATITSSVSNAVIAENMFYFRSAVDGSIVSMYGVQGRVARSNSLTGSFNLYLNMENYLRLANTSGSQVSVDVTITSLASLGSSRTLTIAPYGAIELPLHQTSIYGTAKDSYGKVSVTPGSSVGIIAEVLRLRYSPYYGELEYVAPTNMD